MESKPEAKFLSKKEVASLDLELRLVRPYLLTSDLSGRCYFTERESEELLKEARRDGFDYICIVGTGSVSTSQFSHSQLLNLNYYVRKNQGTKNNP